MRLRLRVLWSLLGVLLASSAIAQTAPAPAHPVQPEAGAEDPLGRSTPRGTAIGFISAMLFLIAGLLFLYLLGINMTAVLTGLGVSGLAVALAAQPILDSACVPLVA
jgi:hypothetical protein